MSKLKSSCPRLVSAGEVRLQAEKLRRHVGTVNWAAVRKGPRGRRFLPVEGVVRRFWERLDTSGSCWTWIGSSDRKGYGVVRLRDHTQLAAHRMAYVLEHGSIPETLCVLHSCDNPSCANPAHLFLGTRQDNVDDMVRKGRQPRGATNGSAKLREHQVLEILRRSKEEHATKLAKEFGVNRSCIGRIIHGLKWSSLTGIAPPKST